VGADVALQREIAGDDFFNGDFLVPAFAAVAFFAAGLRDFLGAAQAQPFLLPIDLRDIYLSNITSSR
jgi:hypothetical protein